MKNAVKVLMVTLLMSYTGLAFAASTTTADVPVSATLDQVLVLDMTIRPETATPGVFGAPVTSMNYTLTRNGNNAIGGNVAYHVWLGANTSGRAYHIDSTVGDLVSGANTLPHAWGLFPVSATDSVNDIPNDTLTTAQYAAGTNKRIYDSNAAGAGAVLELVYGISGGNADGSAPFTGWQPIGPGQTSGTYTASPALTFTLTTNV